MNSEQLQLIEKRYGNLIHMIGHNISGDRMRDHDDNTQDLWIAVMDAIKGYERKEGKTFDEFCNDKGFDKYLKTCLWNLKNSTGARDCVRCCMGGVPRLGTSRVEWGNRGARLPVGPGTTCDCLGARIPVRLWIGEFPHRLDTSTL